jgi:hypothetical protein
MQQEQLMGVFETEQIHDGSTKVVKEKQIELLQNQ